MEHKKIIGGLVGVPNPRPDWNQNDKTKADYIKNKPEVYTKYEVNNLLGRKADVNQITNVYRYCGSVGSEDELQETIVFEACGAPKNHEGEEIGSFDTTTGEVVFNNFKYTIEAGDNLSIVIPVKSVDIKKGWYWYPDVDMGKISISDYDTNLIMDIHDVAGVYSVRSAPEYLNDTSVTEIALILSANYYGASEGEQEIIINGRSAVKGSLTKVMMDEYGNEVPVRVGDVYNILGTGMNVAWTGTEWDSLGGSGRDDEARADIENLEAELDKKANKEDMVSAYKFCGSVEKFEDLPHRYELIPNGVPMLNGKVCGTYDEETHTVKVNEAFIRDYNDTIIVPIVPIDIVAGKYYTTHTYYGDAKIGNLDTYGCGDGGETYLEMPEQTIDYIEIFIVHGAEGTISGTTNHLGYLDKITDSWLNPEDEWFPNVPYIPSDAFDNGNVYNVIKGGMNYAWTGTEWDALGGEHKDIEARWQIGNVDAALDTILEIQNSLIGGDSV